MQKLSRRNEAVGMYEEDDGINDPNDMIALLYRKSRLQQKLLEPPGNDASMREMRMLEARKTTIRGVIEALDAELLKKFVPLLQRKIVEEAETGELLTISEEERGDLQVAKLTRRVRPAAPPPADPGQPETVEEEARRRARRVLLDPDAGGPMYR